MIKKWISFSDKNPSLDTKSIRLYYFRVSLLFEVVNVFSAPQGPPAVPLRSSDHVISLLDKYFAGLHSAACQVCRRRHSSAVCSWGGCSPDVTFHKSGEQMSKIEMEGDKDSKPGRRKSKRQGRWEEGEKNECKNRQQKVWRQKLGPQMNEKDASVHADPDRYKQSLKENKNPGFQGHINCRQKHIRSSHINVLSEDKGVFSLSGFVQQEGIREKKKRCSSENYLV